MIVRSLNIGRISALLCLACLFLPFPGTADDSAMVRAEAQVQGTVHFDVSAALDEVILSTQAVVVRNRVAQSLGSASARSDFFWLTGLNSIRDGQFEAARVFFEAFLMESHNRTEESGGFYWMARAEESLGDYAAAKFHLKESARLGKAGYYSVLARERLGSATFSDALECEAVNEFLGDSPNLGLALATKRKLNHLFPSAQVSLLSRVAKRYNVDETWVIGLARQESAFDAEVVSSAGAIGLMQIMPETANRVLRRKEERLFETSTDLFKPELNAVVGTIYFRKLLRRFKGSELLALAAYNAGPNAVARWQARWPTAEPELLVEWIPFNETRTYVKRVKVWRAKYKSLVDSKEALIKGAQEPSILAHAE